MKVKIKFKQPYEPPLIIDLGLGVRDAHAQPSVKCVSGGSCRIIYLQFEAGTREDRWYNGRGDSLIENNSASS